MNTTITEGKPSNAVYYWIGAGILVALVLGGIYFNTSTPIADNTPVDVATVPTDIIYPYGSVTLKLGETGHFNGISITPLRVEEDSRCAKDVQCVWAGTVKVSVRSDLATGVTSENMVTLGQTTKVDTFDVGLTAVNPGSVSGVKITNADYRLTFEVHQSTVIDTELIGK